MDERRLTLILVPHGDLETRTFEISYRNLKRAIVLVGVVLLLFGFVVASWFPVAAQAGRVRGLERDLARLEGERARVAELAQMLADVEEQYERVRELLGAQGSDRDSPTLPPLRRDTTAPVPQDEELQTAGLGAWPLASRGFSTQVRTKGRHPGIDIASAAGAKIHAAGAGRVSATGFDSIYGYFVLVNHGDGLESLYGHASRVLIAAGDPVGRMQVIALTGSTGRSSGPRLHFEVRKHGRPVNPLSYVQQP